MWMAARKVRIISWWPGVAGEVHGEEFEQIQRFVDRQCMEHASKYDFSVRLEKVFVVNNPRLMSAFDGFRAELQSQEKTSNVRQLFHGTSMKNAMAIVAGGFRLPKTSGMFGKGMYFADTPLKSMQYAKPGGVVLLCDVELGNPKTLYSADDTLAPETDFKRSWLMRAFGQQSYDSVYASAWVFGAVRVPEYVVYKPPQAIPRYVLVMTQTP